MDPYLYYDYIIGAVGLFAVVAFALYGVELFTLAKVEKSGVKTQGKITGKYKRTAKNLVVHYIEVEFSTGLRTVNTKYKVPKKAWDEAQKGATVNLIYLPEKPKHCHQPELVNESWNMLALIGARYFAIFLFIVGITFYQQANPNWMAGFIQPPVNSEDSDSSSYVSSGDDTSSDVSSDDNSSDETSSDESSSDSDSDNSDSQDQNQ